MTFYMIKRVINNSCTKKTIRSIFVDNIEYTDDSLIAETFGKYFSQVAGNLEAEISQSRFDPLSLVPIKSESIFFNPVSASDCQKIIESLKNT